MESINCCRSVPCTGRAAIRTPPRDTNLSKKHEIFQERGRTEQTGVYIFCLLSRHILPDNNAHPLHILFPTKNLPRVSQNLVFLNMGDFYLYYIW